MILNHDHYLRNLNDLQENSISAFPLSQRVMEYEAAKPINLQFESLKSKKRKTRDI